MARTLSQNFLESLDPTLLFGHSQLKGLIKFKTHAILLQVVRVSLQDKKEKEETSHLNVLHSNRLNYNNVFLKL